MELDQLKSIWKKSSDETGEGYFLSKEKLQTLLKKRSQTSVAKIKRRVRNKAMIAGIIGISMMVITLFIYFEEAIVFDFLEPVSNLQAVIFYGTFSIVICFISIYHALSYRRIIQIENVGADLKTSLHSILEVLNKAIRVKVYSDALVIPLTVLVWLVAGRITGNQIFEGTITVLLMIAGAAIYAVIAYYLTRRNQKKRYGNQVKVLEECLAELDADESGSPGYVNF